MKNSHKILIGLALVFLMATAILGYGYVYARLPAVVLTEITLRDLPIEFDGTKVVFISDVHLGPWRSAEWLSDIVAKINDLQPDVVLLGGDYVEQGTKYMEGAFNELGKLRAPLGLYGVMGNHDYLRGSQMAPVLMQKNGIKYLDNTGFWINQDNSKIRICGIGDLYFGEQLYAEALGEAVSEDAVIMVSHQPDYVEMLPDDRVDLMLSGHTHGGQITLFGLWAPIIPSKYGHKYLTGYFETAKTKLLVSNGLGTFKYPLRYFARPQVNVVVLRIGG